jgi:hypothetical protein
MEGEAPAMFSVSFHLIQSYSQAVNGVRSGREGEVTERGALDIGEIKKAPAIPFSPTTLYDSSTSFRNPDNMTVIIYSARHG